MVFVFLKKSLVQNQEVLGQRKMLSPKSHILDINIFGNDTL